MSGVRRSVRAATGDPVLAAAFVVLALLAFGAIVGPALPGRGPDFVDLDQRLLPPLRAGHWLGTDQLGRDLGARLLSGMRRSVATAGAATLVASVLGTLLGLVAARDRSWLAAAVAKVTTLTQAFPVFVLAAAVVAVAGNGYVAVVLALGLMTWPVFGRVVRAEAASLFTRDHVLAARMMQMRETRLVFWHVMPGLVPSLAVLVPFHFADMLIAESALSFLGIGAHLGEASWGTMLSDSRAYLLTAPWLLLVPATMIVVVVIVFNLLGDATRRWFG